MLENCAAFFRNVRPFALLLLVAAPRQITANPWLRVESQNFILYTADHDTKGRQLLQRLERARLLFAARGLIRPSPPVRIVVFNSDEEYRHYAACNFSGGEFRAIETNDHFILLKASELNNNTSALHEYTHEVFSRVFPNLPVWLSEGLAEVYSSAACKGVRCSIGGFLWDRVGMLDPGATPSLNWILKTDNHTLEQIGLQQVREFYTWTWILVHMLMIDPRYADRFPQVLTAATSSEVLLESIYGKDSEEIVRDLQAYASKERLPKLNFALPSTHVKTFAIAPSKFEMELLFAELLTSNPTTEAEAMARLADLSREYTQPEPEEQLGLLAFRQGGTKDAKGHFALAIQRGSVNPDVLLHYARLELEDTQSTSEIIDLLKRVLILRPDDSQARLLLGYAAVKAENFNLAISELKQIRTSEDRYWVEYLLSYCHMGLNNLEEAYQFGLQAESSAGDLKEREEVNRLLSYIDSQRSH
jgi:hypothetical protein